MVILLSGSMDIIRMLLLDICKIRRAANVSNRGVPCVPGSSGWHNRTNSNLILLILILFLLCAGTAFQKSCLYY